MKRIRRPIDLFKPTVRSRRATAAATYRALRPVVRLAAWHLDGQRCIWPTCRRPVRFEDAHAHEIINRSLGGNPLDVDQVVTTCASCHADLHVRVGGKRKQIIGTRARGLQFLTRGPTGWAVVTGWR